MVNRINQLIRGPWTDCMTKSCLSSTNDQSNWEAEGSLWQYDDGQSSSDEKSSPTSYQWYRNSSRQVNSQRRKGQHQSNSAGTETDNEVLCFGFHSPRHSDLPLLILSVMARYAGTTSYDQVLCIWLACLPHWCQEQSDVTWFPRLIFQALHPIDWT